MGLIGRNVLYLTTNRSHMLKLYMLCCKLISERIHVYTRAFVKCHAGLYAVPKKKAEYKEMEKSNMTHYKNTIYFTGNWTT